MLLDSLGDSEVNITDEGCSELLHRLVTTGLRSMKIDPTQTDETGSNASANANASAGMKLKLTADQWTSVQDIEKERVRLQSQIASDLSAESKDGKQGNDQQEGADEEEEESLDQKYGGRVDENLSAHVSFTLSLLERLCNAINESAGATVQIDTVNAMNELRQLRSAKLLLTDRVIKLSTEIVDMSAKLRIAENEKIRAERDLDRAILNAKEAELAAVSAAAASGAFNHQASTTSSNPDGTVSTTTAGGLVMPGSPMPTASAAVERDLRRQLELLERQLAESESAKAQVEMTLTERLARPLPQTEVQVADMRNAMEELRQQCKQRVSTLIAEVRKKREQNNMYAK